MKNKKKTKCEQKEKEIKEAIRRAKSGKWSYDQGGILKMVGKDWAVKAVKKADAKNLPTIKILAEREVKMVELDLDIPDETEQRMYEYGLKHILKDRKHLVNWVFNLALSNMIETYKKKKK